MATLIDFVVALLLILGAAFLFAAAFGALRASAAFGRIQAFAKAGTLGATLIFLAAAIAAGDFAVFMRALGAAGLVFLNAAFLAPLLAECDGTSRKFEALPAER